MYKIAQNSVFSGLPGVSAGPVVVVCSTTTITDIEADLVPLFYT